MNSSTAHSAVPTRESSDSSIAPAWHTVVLLFLMFGLSFIGAHVHLPGIFGAHGRARVYLVVILSEWTTVSFIWWGLSLRGIRMRDLVGGSWARPVHFLRDLGLGLAFILIFTVLGHVLTAISIRTMLPPSFSSARS